MAVVSCGSCFDMTVHLINLHTTSALRLFTPHNLYEVTRPATWNAARCSPFGTSSIVSLPLVLHPRNAFKSDTSWAFVCLCLSLSDRRPSTNTGLQVLSSTATGSRPDVMELTGLLSLCFQTHMTDIQSINRSFKQYPLLESQLRAFSSQAAATRPRPALVRFSGGLDALEHFGPREVTHFQQHRLLRQQR